MTNEVSTIIDRNVGRASMSLGAQWKHKREKMELIIHQQIVTPCKYTRIIILLDHRNDFIL